MTTDDPAARAPRAQSLAVAGLVVAILAVFVIIAGIGAGQAARQQRVLPWLDGAAQQLRVSGEALREWSIANGSRLGWATTVLASAIAVAGCVLGGWQALPLLLLAAAVSLAVWGQVLLLQDQITTAVLLYGGGLVCAIGFGIWCPTVWRAPSRPRRSGLSGWECLALLLVTTAAVLTRLYALSELPRYFEIENVVSMLATRTMAGLHEYVPIGLTGNSNGLAHLLPQFASFNLLGTSVYSLRLVSVCFGMATLLLFYWLVRRLAGVGPALVGAALLIAAPEQLFWSRSEVTPFAALALFSLVTAHLGLSMVTRLSFRTVLAAALWMPFSFLFYLPARVMLLYPLLLYAHALVFRGRAAWRTVWYAVPLFAGGLALTYFSLTFVFLPVNNWQWRFIQALPADTTILRGEGQFHETNLLKLVGHLATGVAQNLGEVAKSMTYRAGFSEWYSRADNERHPTNNNVAMVVVAALALAYLLGQVHEPRSFVLLLWVGLGLLPGVMSANPGPRRIGLIYPGLYAAAAVGLGAVVRLIRARAGRVLADVAGVLLAVAVAGIIWTSMASYFLVRTGIPWVEKAARATAPLFEAGTVIYNNIDSAVLATAVFLNVDRFLQTTPGIRYVGPGEWLPVALRQPCDFTDVPFRFTLTPAEVERLRRTYNPTRMCVLMMDEPHNRPYMDLLRALYPAAKVSTFAVGEEQGAFWMFTVERAATEALRSPALEVAADAGNAAQLATGLIADVRLTPVTAEEGRPEASDGIAVRGGLLLEHDGWYRAAIEPPCAAARLTIDNHDVVPADVWPMRVGVHSLQIALPNADACARPLHLRFEVYDGQRYAPLAAPLLLTPALSVLPQTAAPPVSTNAGYGHVEPVPAVGDSLVDFGLDGQGTMTFVVQDKNGTVRIRRVRPDGQEEATWPIVRPPGAGLPEISVAPDGVSFVVTDGSMTVYDQHGTKLDTWKDALVTTSAIGHLPDGRVLIPLSGQHAIGLLTRDGTVVQEWKRFAGGPGTFFEPVAVAVRPNGDILIVQSDGRALLFGNGGGGFNPEFVRTFQVDFDSPNVHPRGCSLVGSDRVVLFEPETGKRLIYDLDGARVMASDPARDVDHLPFSGLRRIQSVGDRLYVLDDRGLWRVSR